MKLVQTSSIKINCQNNLFGEANEKRHRKDLKEIQKQPLQVFLETSQNSQEKPLTEYLF